MCRHNSIVLHAAAEPPATPKFPFDAKSASQYQKDYAAWAELPVEFSNDMGMTFVLVPPGTFLMGSPDDEPGRNPGGYDEGPQHQVTLTRPFYLGKHEVTFGQFRALRRRNEIHHRRREKRRRQRPRREGRMEAPARHELAQARLCRRLFKQDKMHPAVHVSHTDAMAFCKWLAEQPGEG